MVEETLIKNRYLVLQRLVELLETLFHDQWSTQVRTPFALPIWYIGTKKIKLILLQMFGDSTLVTAPRKLTQV
jgi:hypothetical protein